MSTVAKCIDDLKLVASSIPSTKGITELVYSEKELLELSRLAEPPFIGVVYEGIFPTDDFSNQSLSNSVSMVIIVAYPEQGVKDGDKQKLDALTTLEELRSCLRTRKSPTGHFWRFKVEAPAKLEKGNLVWIQRWYTAFNS